MDADEGFLLQTFPRLIQRRRLEEEGKKGRMGQRSINENGRAASQTGKRKAPMPLRTYTQLPPSCYSGETDWRDEHFSVKHVHLARRGGVLALEIKAKNGRNQSKSR